MGRPAGRFTAAKTFTLDIMTLEWLNRTCLERKTKASALLTEIIEKYRIGLNRDAPDETSTIDVYCKGCNDWKPHDVDMVCKGCDNINEALKAKIEKRREWNAKV
jgi:hypothetical protein